MPVMQPPTGPIDIADPNNVPELFVYGTKNSRPRHQDYRASNDPLLCNFDIGIASVFSKRQVITAARGRAPV